MRSFSVLSFLPDTGSEQNSFPVIHACLFKVVLSNSNTSFDVTGWVISNHVKSANLNVVFIALHLDGSFGVLVSDGLWLSVQNAIIIVTIEVLEHNLEHNCERFRGESWLMPVVREKQIVVCEVDNDGLWVYHFQGTIPLFLGPPFCSHYCSVS